MYEFQLYRSNEENYPDQIQVGDTVYDINADYRVILRIIRIQQQDDVMLMARNRRCLELFYKDGFPADDPMMYMWMFVRRCKSSEEDDRDNGSQTMCYYRDADVIMSSFRAQYGIDLNSQEFMHWYEFLMLVDGLGEDTPLMRRIHLRQMSTKGYEGQELLDLLAAKKRVALVDPEEREKAFARSMMSRMGLGRI